MYLKKPELLAPAGNLTKLKIALAYGADAVYASTGSFSLRQRSAKEFSKESFAQGVAYAHERGKKLYATVNGFATNGQLGNIERHLEFLRDLRVDGILIATPGVASLARAVAPEIPIHVSTQANVLNYLDAQVWAELGAVRIVAAREMTLKDAVEIKDKIPNLQIEIFVHGSMCFAYSGRCLVSAVQSGRFSNRGSCANDCRFNYELYAKNPETSALFRLQEREGEGTFVMNAKDLSLISHVQKIMQTGAIDSFKIEGRTKSEYYVACATNAYRAAIDDAASDKFEAGVYEREIATLKNRGFSDGYLIKRPYEREDTQNLDRSIELGTHQVCAISQDGEFISVKDKILPGESYEIFAPRGFEICACDNEIGEIFELDGKPYLKFKKLQSRSGKEFSEIHSGNLNEIKLPAKLAEFCFLRKEIE